MIKLFSFFAWLSLPFVSILHFGVLNFAPATLLFSPFLAILFFIYVLRKNSFPLKLLVFTLYFILVLVLGSITLLNSHSININEYVKSSAAILLFILSTIGLTFSLIRYTESAILGLVIGFKIFCVIGIIEVALKFAFGLDVVVSYFDLFFSGQTGSRIQVTAFEPSVLSRICAFYYFLLFLNVKIKPVYFYINTLILLFSFSAIGIIIGIICFIIIGVYFVGKKLLYRSVFYSCIFTILTVFLFNSIDLDRNHATARIEKLSDVTSLSSLVLIDGSIAVRVFSPVIAYDISLDNPFGVGLGQFSNYYKSYGTKYLSDIAKRSPEVRKKLYEGQGNPQSLYAFLFVESGWFSFLLFVVFLVLLLISLMPFSKATLFLFTYLSLVFLQTDTFLFSINMAAIAFLVSNKKFLKGYYFKTIDYKLK